MTPVLLSAISATSAVTAIAAAHVVLIVAALFYEKP